MGGNERGDVSNRLSTSLIDFTEFMRISDSGPLKSDKGNPSVNTAFPGEKPATNSASYLEARKFASSLNSGHGTLLSQSRSSTAANANPTSNKKDSGDYSIEESLVIGELQVDTGPSGRSGSMQWFQNTVQNVTNKYRDFFEPRSTGDEKEMDSNDPEYETLDFGQDRPGPRRFSENAISKQNRRHQQSPFSSKIGHLRELWKERFPPHGNKKQEDKDHDQNRPDVCPLFIFPRKIDEDEMILDALRQAMRKCTAPAASARPTSATVLDQLSRLLD